MGIWLISDVDCEFECFRPGYREGANQGNPGLTKGIPELLNFFNQYGIRATFHLQEQRDPNFSVVTKYPELYRMVMEHDQEISLHVHVKRGDYQTRKSEIGAAVQRLQEHGYKVDTFRAGWYFTNENTIRVLEELGIKYDCSPVKNSWVGPMSWFKIPDSPYHPSYDDITKVGNARVLIIPITNRRLGIVIHKDTEWEAELMKRGVQILASMAQEMEEPVILYFTTHCWKSIETNSSSFRAWEAKRRREFFEFLTNFAVKTLTVKEAGALWEEKGVKPYFLEAPDLWTTQSSPRPLRYLRWLNKHVGPRKSFLRYKLFGEL